VDGHGDARVRAALDHVAARARAARAEAVGRIAAVLGPDDLAALTALFRAAPTTVNFHPDQLLADGSTVADGLLADGRYRSQFETGTSAGGRTAYRGGARAQWEEHMFGGAYGDEIRGRPVYGGLNLLDFTDGACPRFGSCHLRLAPHVRSRSTYSAHDSRALPRDVGIAGADEPVLAALCEATARLPLLRERWAAGGACRGAGPGRALDEYVEVQVHGGLDLARDVTAVVVDPAFCGTRVGEVLEAVASRYGIALERHQGFTLAPSEVPADFHGPLMPHVARRVQREFGVPGRRIDAATIGRAAAGMSRDSATVTNLKQLWFVLVAFGTPAER
jgi:Protein of unknown function (DUF3626)